MYSYVLGLFCLKWRNGRKPVLAFLLLSWSHFHGDPRCRSNLHLVVLEVKLTCMVVFPPSSRALANKMLSWNTRSLVVFMMRSMTRSDAPSLSRWHCTSIRLISPRLRDEGPPPQPGRPTQRKSERVSKARNSEGCSASSQPIHTHVWKVEIIELLCA